MCEIIIASKSNGVKIIQKGIKNHFQNLDGKRFLKNNTMIFEPMTAMSLPLGFITTEENLEKIVLRLLGV